MSSLSAAAPSSSPHRQLGREDEDGFECLERFRHQLQEEEESSWLERGEPGTNEVDDAPSREASQRALSALAEDVDRRSSGTLSSMPLTHSSSETTVPATPPSPSEGTAAGDGVDLAGAVPSVERAEDVVEQLTQSSYESLSYRSEGSASETLQHKRRSDDEEEDEDAARRDISWRTLPSALTLERPPQRQLVVFLDYDGTLTPIVSDPATARLSSTMRDAVRRLAARAPVAVVSGRAREKIHEFVDLAELYYAGSHGFDIDGPGGLRHAVSTDIIPLLSATAVALNERLKDIDGVSLEDNRFAISVHWRNVSNAEARVRVENIVDEVLSLPPYVGALRKSYGKCVYELRPNVRWDKGEAVLYLLELLRRTKGENEEEESAKQNWYKSILPVYIGDDTTDEDAFGALKPLGGVCVLNVARTDETQRPQFTKATHVLRGVEDVETFLNFLAQE